MMRNILSLVIAGCLLAVTASAQINQPGSGEPTGAAGGDLGSTYPSPTVTSSHLASPLPVAQGGTAGATVSAARSSLGVAAGTVGLNKLTATAVTTATTLSLPAGATILQIVVVNTTMNAVTGGLKFGSTMGGVDIVAALTVAASVFSPPATLLLSQFSGAQTIFVDAVAAWNSASVNITVLYAL